jgi:hypothetical protein
VASRVGGGVVVVVVGGGLCVLLEGVAKKGVPERLPHILSFFFVFSFGR